MKRIKSIYRPILDPVGDLTLLNDLTMKVLVFEKGRLGVAIDDDTILDLRSAAESKDAERIFSTKSENDRFLQISADLQSFIEAGEWAIEKARALFRWFAELGDAKRSRIPNLTGRLQRSRIAPALPSSSSKIICAGSNFASHAARVRGQPVESMRKQLEQSLPWGFLKLSSCIVGPYDDIIYPARTKELDYEVEVAAIIGKSGKDIAREEAMSYVWGYTVFMDYCLRDQEGDRGTPYTVALGKNFDTSGVLGPWIVSKDEIPDPHSLAMELSVNGEPRQKGNTSDMVKKFPEMIGWYSRDLTIYPGDVFASGTCSGTAYEKRNSEKDYSWFLKPGDVVEGTVEKIGSVRNAIRKR